VEATIAEISRINPIAPITVPHTAIKDTELGGYNIRKVIYVVVMLPVICLVYD
jgi:cytochrome P450